MTSRRWVLIACTALLATAAFVLGQRGCGESTPRTVILFTIDTWRRDHASFHASGWPDTTLPTPVLAEFARKAVRFHDARTPVPLTLPAHVTMFSGLPPAVTGVRVNAYGRITGPEERGFPLLAERLKAEGWRTAAFVSAEPLDASHGLAQGFEVYDDAADDPDPESPGYVGARPGADTVARAVAWIRSLPADAPAFVWVHVFEPHAPYLGSYAQDVRAADACVGTLLDGLEAAGRGDAAMLVTSDHGEMLDELDERTHGNLLGDAVLRVPFLLRAHGVTPTQRDDPVDLADVAPTLAGLAGVSFRAPAGPFTGRDLLAGPVPADRVRVAESLFAHQRFRWAQLVAAIDAKGTLIDVGAGRARWLPLAPWGQPQRSATEVTEAPAHLVDALAAYKKGEVPGRMLAGTAPPPYGTSAPALPFLTPEENARLPDPYREIFVAQHLDEIRAILAVLRGNPDPKRTRAVGERLKPMLEKQPNNPEALFLAGMLAEQRWREEPDKERAKEELAVAETLFGQAFERGRNDAATLFHWCGVNAPGRERECLTRLMEMGRSVVWDASLWALKGSFHGALKETDEAAAACKRARSLVHGAPDRTVENLCVGR
jgi:hypothetical protein